MRRATAPYRCDDRALIGVASRPLGCRAWEDEVKGDGARRDKSGDMARPHAHAGVEMIYVLTGELEVTVEATVHALESGDAMYFDASVPHSYRRTGRTSCTALIVSVA